MGFNCGCANSVMLQITLIMPNKYIDIAHIDGWCTHTSAKHTHFLTIWPWLQCGALCWNSATHLLTCSLHSDSFYWGHSLLWRLLSDRFKRRIGFIWTANQFYVCGNGCLRSKKGLFWVILERFCQSILPSFTHLGSQQVTNIRYMILPRGFSSLLLLLSSSLLSDGTFLHVMRSSCVHYCLVGRYYY